MASNPPTTDTSAAPEAGPPADLPKMMEMKKTYEFWRNIVSKNPHNNEAYLPFPQEDKAASKQDMELLRGLRLSMGKGADTLLNDTELNFLKTRIGEFISFTGIGPFSQDHDEPREGYSMYGTQDEEGLYDGNADGDERGDHDGDDGDDYDIEEIGLGERFLYGYGPTHHIEVELNDGPLDARDVDPNEPLCEFTFEYDHTGKLVPTYSNIEEKLRLVSLQSRMADGEVPAAKKKSKKKKKKAAHGAAPGGAGHGDAYGVLDDACCMFCQYEAYFGTKPVHMMMWYDQTTMKEEKRRQRIKEKLERAKLNAFQHDLRTMHTGHDHADGDGAEDN